MVVFPVAYFSKETIINGELRYPARSIAVPPLPTDKEKMRLMYEDKHWVAFFDANQLFTDFKNAPNRKILFTHIGSGIGDVIAFSAIAEYLRDKTLRVYVSDYLKPIFKWFSNQKVQLFRDTDVIATDYTPANRVIKYSNMARLRMEWAAVEGGTQNWYDAMFNRMGISEAPPAYMRPRLIKRNDSVSRRVAEKNSLLICHRASCQIRSSKFEDFYIPAKEVYPNHRIYVHDRNLTEEDRAFALKTKVIIIGDNTLSEYLDDVYTASMVISTDTAALHLREGVEKPCLGVYGGFTTDARTKGYIYTKSFNAKSDCPHQPCFMHETHKLHTCLNSSPEDAFAKCQSGLFFQEQLYQNLVTY